MPDDCDYEWLGWLVTHPEEWTEPDLSSARFIIGNQKRALESLHSKDAQGRGSVQKLIDELEAAVEAHLSKRA